MGGELWIGAGWLDCLQGHSVPVARTPPSPLRLLTACPSARTLHEDEDTPSLTKSLVSWAFYDRLAISAASCSVQVLMQRIACATWAWQDEKRKELEFRHSFRQLADQSPVKSASQTNGEWYCNGNFEKNSANFSEVKTWDGHLKLSLHAPVQGEAEGDEGHGGRAKKAREVVPLSGKALSLLQIVEEQVERGADEDVARWAMAVNGLMSLNAPSGLQNGL